MAQNTFPTMRFSQLDRIVELVPGKSIVAERRVHEEEDFLRDHFPLFAVLPGVLMLEALYQASCWLIRETLDYKCSVLYLAEAKNVKFGDFVGPGETLTITSELVKQDGDRFSMKCQGMKGDQASLSARLVITQATASFGGDPYARHNDFVAIAKKEQFQQMFTEGAPRARHC